ncbi:unnamed protein product [Mesocestoides corti]|uniref:Uncharacterized protein n=1 Tax=Mesocestoides corti TaxID=53468 RepID=A0A0R3UB68_MESCO|nr:unnamed protein product [Mesocestoides corti]
MACEQGNRKSASQRLATGSCSTIGGQKANENTESPPERRHASTLATFKCLVRQTAYYACLATPSPHSADKSTDNMVSAAALTHEMSLTPPGWSMFELRTRTSVWPPPSISPFSNDKSQEHIGHPRDSGLGYSIGSITSSASSSGPSSAPHGSSNQTICPLCFTVTLRSTLPSSSCSGQVCEQCIARQRNDEVLTAQTSSQLGNAGVHKRWHARTHTYRRLDTV